LKSEQEEYPESDLPLKKIGKPAFRAINLAGYHRLEQLTGITEKELGKLHGVGPKAINLLRQLLSEQGMGFAPE
jgi:hypothetical protein